MKTNVLYYGDNLDILRRYVPDGSVDLVYLDPPFNSQRDYNVIFRDESGNRSDAQLVAFEDTWHWGPDAEQVYAYLTNTHQHGGKVASNVSTLVSSLRAAIGENQMLAYLVEMTVRLIELRRVLKPTGTLYLHCDPTASHYLKVLLDGVFGPEQFLNEVVWRRTGTHSSAKRWGPVHDILLVYARQAGKATWNRLYVPMSDTHVRQHYGQVDAKGRAYTHGELTAPGTRNGKSGEPWHGFDVTAIGRHWITTVDRLDELDAQGRIYWPKGAAWPRLIRFQDESKGRALGDVWEDIPPINMQAKERLGYPTQKPVALLERIIEASSNPGDVVLDPFCGCGTAVVAAQRLGREWVGIDVTYLAIRVMRQRMVDSFPALGSVDVIGQPTEVQGVRDWLASLGTEGPWQFQWWATELVGATPQGGTNKKGADQGVDGIITFTDHLGDIQSVIVSVKSGKVNAGMVQGLKGAMETHKAAMGLFVTLDEPSGPMRKEAAIAGAYHSELTGKDYPRLQILSIRELLEDGKKPDLPLMVLPAFQKAPKSAPKVDQAELFG